MVPSPPPPQRYELEVRPERDGARWHAVLTDRATAATFEFDSPLALLRHLAQQTLADRPQGLR